MPANPGGTLAKPPHLSRESILETLAVDAYILGFDDLDAMICDWTRFGDVAGLSASTLSLLRALVARDDPALRLCADCREAENHG